MWHFEKSLAKQTFERTNESEQQARRSPAKIFQPLDNSPDSISLKRRSRLFRHPGGEKGPWALNIWGCAASELSLSSWAWMMDQAEFSRASLGGTWHQGRTKL